MIKRSRGGSDELDNLVLLCRRCHDRMDAAYRVGRLVVVRDEAGRLRFDVVTKADKWAAA